MLRRAVRVGLLATIVSTAAIAAHAQSPGTPCAQGSAGCASYEVVIEFIGYTGLIEGAPNCVVNPRGYDRLSGTLTGLETSDEGEDVIYTGTLRRETQIDFCEAKGKTGPDDDERVYCTVTLTGSARTYVELTVYGEEGRGAYMNATPMIGAAPASVVGGCDQEVTDQIRADYPSASDGGGASPNGQPIDEDHATDPSGEDITFVVDGLARLRVGSYPTAQKGWSLRVIRKVS